LSHFITGHQFVATEGGVTVAFDYASSSQFVDAVISPVASRYVRERICSISRSGYASAIAIASTKDFFIVVSSSGSSSIIKLPILYFYKSPSGATNKFRSRVALFPLSSFAGITFAVIYKAIFISKNNLPYSF
jgi:hypothetical protein